jgi:hypothetical protein
MGLLQKSNIDELLIIINSRSIVHYLDCELIRYLFTKY